jgi:hypothetical protein
MKVKCIICDKEMDVIPSRAAKFKTCSLQCMGILASRRNTRTTINCIVCGNSFNVKKSHVSRRKTCSMECNRIHKSNYSKGSGNHQYGLKGNLNSSYKGRITSRNGYRFIYIPDHPYADVNGRIRLHRYIVEKYKDIPDECKDDQGYLLPTIEIHHIDGDKYNDTPDNLQIVTKGEHRSIHNKNRTIIRDKINGRIIGVSKQGELLESCDANQQPSLSRNTREGSTTNSRILTGKAEDSNTDTSALHS